MLYIFFLFAVVVVSVGRSVGRKNVLDCIRINGSRLFFFFKWVFDQGSYLTKVGRSFLQGKRTVTEDASHWKAFVSACGPLLSWMLSGNATVYVCDIIVLSKRV